MKLLDKIKKYGLGNIVRYLDSKYGLGRLEYLISINWFNPFLTLWVNLRSFPFRQAIKMPFWVYGRPRFYSLSGRMKITGRVKSGQIQFNKARPGAPSLMSCQSELYNLGQIVFEGTNITIGCGVKIFVERKALLALGGNLKIQDMVNIGCIRYIKIGYQSWITHRCQVMDSNYHFIANFNNHTIPDRTHPIVIGKGCWIGNSTTVTGGTILPEFTIVSSNSLVNKHSNSTPSNSVIGGIPAKLIGSGFRCIENQALDVSVRKYYRDHNDIFPLPNDVDMMVCSTVK